MAKRFLITTLVLAALTPAAAHAAAPPFSAHADLRPEGCTQTLADGVVRLSGCAAEGRAVGTVSGRLRISYSAKVALVRGAGVQQGTLTLASASGKDVLVADFHGTVSMSSGLSRGTWKAVRRQGSFAKLAGGSYSSRTRD